MVPESKTVKLIVCAETKKNLVLKIFEKSLD